MDKLRLLPLMLALGLAWGPAALSVEPVTEGTLQILDKDNLPVGVCPLEHTDVQVDISGFVARVNLTQHFKNPLNEPIEAVYTFPMSERAAVDAMDMRIGDRVFKGVIKKREEARQAYEAAKLAGQAASLLDQERPNIFTQSVANILPGDKVEIRISYVEYLEYGEGEYAFAFPMVVGPRYIPGNLVKSAATDQVPDAARISPPVTPEGTRAGHDISVAVKVDAGVPLRDVRSELHEVETEQPSETQAVVKLKEKSEIPNRDFILRYKVAGEDIEDAVMTHADARGGFFTLIVQPPARVKPEAITPKEMIFVIDCSGSMSGFPIEKAKATMRQCIEGMNPDDTFNLVSFAGGTGYCFERSVPNTPDNRRQALSYLEALEGGGGTEMMGAIRAALEKQDDSERLRVVCFMTDGFIGNDMEILDAIQQNVKTARVFAFGIGNSVNRFLIEGMGRTGRGASEIVTLQSEGDEAAARFHDRIQSPLLTDISLDFGRLPVEDVFPDPDAIPDLFAARPLVLKGRYTGSGDGVITVRGTTAQGPFERRIQVNLPKEAAEHDVLAPLWARERIAWLMDKDWLGIQRGNADTDIKDSITELGLKYNLVTQFTSFVAIEERKVTEGGQPKTVQVPVEMPDGVSYEGVFGQEASGFGVASKGISNMPALSVASPAPPQASRVESLMRRQSAADTAQASPGRAAAVKPEAEAKVMEEPPAEESEVDESESEKIAPELRGLKAKLVNGNYSEGSVKVENGWVKVFVRLSEDGPDQIRALRDQGAEIVSHAKSNRMVLVRVRVENLDRIAKLDVVEKIMPAKF